MKTVKITMLTTEDCRRCKSVEARLATAAKRIGVMLDIHKVDCLSSAAVDIGIQHGFDDIPSMVVGGKGLPSTPIGGKGLCGDSFSDDELTTVLKAAAGAK